MSYKQIKWMILVIPTLTLGIWEYARHSFLLPYISMSLGNWLAPVIVIAISLIFLLPLFAMLERVHDELQRERAEKAALVERERIARTLHDGLAQSLFLLGVQADQLNRRVGESETKEQVESLHRTVHQVNAYVRQAISGLRAPEEASPLPMQEQMSDIVRHFARETGIHTALEWDLPDRYLTADERRELTACVREALMNIRKHADSQTVHIRANRLGTGIWRCIVEDDGQGFSGDPFAKPEAYGLRMMRERADRLGWSVCIRRENKRTVVEIEKGAGA